MSPRGRFGRKKKVSAKKPKPTAARKSYQRARAINSNARAIAAVKRELKGPVQKNFQKLERVIIPVATRPIAFDATDFTCKNTSVVLGGTPQVGGTTSTGCRLYQYDTTVPTPVLQYVSNWQKTSFTGNPFWAGMNQDIPDGGCYTPLRVTYNIKVTGVPAIKDCRVRVDLFAAKPRAYIPGTVPLDVCMPVALKHMGNMADGDVFNRINRDYFKVYKTKTIYMNSTRVTQGNPIATTANSRWFKLHIHPKKDRTQNVTNPIDPLDPRPEVAEGNFGYLQTPLDEPLWMMISTTDQSGGTDTVVVDITRECVWRDKTGSAKLI